MSRFIPQTSIPVFPPDQEQPDPNALRAVIYTETPVWAVERITGAAELAQEVYGPAAKVIQVFALQLAIALVCLRGDNAPDDTAFPVYCRDKGDAEALRVRADWLCHNLSTRAIQRLLREVTDRATLAPDVVGN